MLNQHNSKPLKTVPKFKALQKEYTYDQRPKNQPDELVVVVQTTLDSAVHWIHHYPVDKYLGNDYPLDRDLSGGQRYPPSEQLGPELQELYGQVDQGIEVYKSNYISIILFHFLLREAGEVIFY